jgi:hypothetical protein
MKEISLTLMHIVWSKLILDEEYHLTPEQVLRVNSKNA